MTSDDKKGRYAPVVDFDRFLDKEVYVKFVGGRECRGILKGWDHLVNLVIDEAVEYLCDLEGTLTGETRKLGLIVCRSLSVMTISPMDGFTEIENPFVGEAVEE